MDNIALISNHPNVLIERGQTVQSNRATSKATEVLRLKASGALTNDEIAKLAGIGVASVYRILKAAEPVSA